MTNAYTNYASTFTFGGTSIGSCIVVDYPDIKPGTVESTNHASGGYTEFIPAGLIALGEFSLSVIVASGVVNAMKTAAAAKTVSACVITDPAGETITFSGMYSDIKIEAADAQNPDIVKATVSIQPTGAITITG